ncbi:MAG: WecB/TagA/CpsF family glycosyltransferase [Pseudomonadales bacterium]|nr:WecB/TagA/CpsF family glycosyltransferase [Pseudomonadales bacterium]
MQTVNSTRLLNTPIHILTESQVLEIVKNTIDNTQRLRIGVVNASKLVAMQSDQKLYEDVVSSDLVLADGMSVVWASRLIGPKLPQRIAGIDLMFRFFEMAQHNNYGVYCLGASEEVSLQVIQNLQADYPGLKISGRRNGYFTDAEAEDVARDIRDSKPHFLLVAMTSPKKENFMGEWGDSLNIPIVHGVGGSFDVYAGKVQRAPLAWQNLGLEWLYRVKQEPGRLWKRYTTTNLKFCWLLSKELLNRLFGRN